MSLTVAVIIFFSEQHVLIPDAFPAVTDLADGKKPLGDGQRTLNLPQKNRMSMSAHQILSSKGVGNHIILGCENNQ